MSSDFPPIRRVALCCGRDADDKSVKHGWRCLLRPYRESPDAARPHE